MSESLTPRNIQQLLVIARSVSYYRRLRGLSQEQLAAKIGRSRTHISNFEAQSTPYSISLECLLNIADALDVDAALLLSAPLPPANQITKKH